MHHFALLWKDERRKNMNCPTFSSELSPEQNWYGEKMYQQHSYFQICSWYYQSFDVAIGCWLVGVLKMELVTKSPHWLNASWVTHGFQVGIFYSLAHIRTSVTSLSLYRFRFLLPSICTPGTGGRGRHCLAGALNHTPRSTVSEAASITTQLHIQEHSDPAVPLTIHCLITWNLMYF